MVEPTSQTVACPRCGQRALIAAHAVEPVRCAKCRALITPGGDVGLPAGPGAGDIGNATQVCAVSPQELLAATQKATPTIPPPVAVAMKLLDPRRAGCSESERMDRLAQCCGQLTAFIEANQPLPGRQWDVGWAYAMRARVLQAVGRTEESHPDLLEAYARKADLVAHEILDLARACVLRRVDTAPALGLYKKFMPYLLEHAREQPGGENGLMEFFVRLTSETSVPNQEERSELCTQLAECRPNSSVAQFLVGLRLHMAGQQQEALAFLRRAEELMQADRTLPASWKGRIVQTLGRVQVALGRHEEARNSFERSLSHDPDQVEAYRDYVLLEVHLLRKVPPQELAHPRHHARLERARRNLEQAEKNLLKTAGAMSPEQLAAQRRKMSVAGNEIERMLGSV